MSANLITIIGVIAVFANIPIIFFQKIYFN